MKESTWADPSVSRLNVQSVSERSDLECNAEEVYYEMDESQMKPVHIRERTPGSPVSTIQEERFSYGLGSSVSSSLPVLGRGGTLTMMEEDYCPHHGL